MLGLVSQRKVLKQFLPWIAPALRYNGFFLFRPTSVKKNRQQFVQLRGTVDKDIEGSRPHTKRAQLPLQLLHLGSQGHFFTTKNIQQRPHSNRVETVCRTLATLLVAATARAACGIA